MHSQSPTSPPGSSQTFFDPALYQASAVPVLAIDAEKDVKIIKNIKL
jgi:hypothetical protein